MGDPQQFGYRRRMIRRCLDDPEPHDAHQEKPVHCLRVAQSQRGGNTRFGTIESADSGQTASVSGKLLS
jgi:hypothetical protein